MQSLPIEKMFEKGMIVAVMTIMDQEIKRNTSKLKNVSCRKKKMLERGMTVGVMMNVMEHERKR